MFECCILICCIPIVVYRVDLTSRFTQLIYSRKSRDMQRKTNKCMHLKYAYIIKSENDQNNFDTKIYFLNGTKIFLSYLQIVLRTNFISQNLYL